MQAGVLQDEKDPKTVAYQGGKENQEHQRKQELVQLGVIRALEGRSSPL